MNMAPPGWYGDPTQPGFVRYWDGTAWTPHVQPAAQLIAPPRRVNRGLIALAWIVGVLLAITLTIGILHAVAQARRNNCLRNATTIDQISKC